MNIIDQVLKEAKWVVSNKNDLLKRKKEIEKKLFEMSSFSVFPDYGYMKKLKNERLEIINKLNKME